MSKPFLVVVVGFYSLVTCGQGANIYFHGPAALSMAGNYVAVPQAISLSPNPALSFSQNTYYYFSSTNFYSLPDLWHLALTSQWQIDPKSTFGASLSRYGDKDLNENYLEGRYGRMLSDKLTIGTTLSLFQWQFTGYDQFKYVGVQGGLGWKPSSLFTFGYTFYIHTLSKTLRVHLPQHIHKLGLSYHPTPQLTLCSQINYSWRSTLTTHWGMRYTLIPALTVLMGFSTQPFTFGAGVNIIPIPTVAIDLAIQHHQTLGYTVGIGLAYIPVKDLNRSRK